MLDQGTLIPAGQVIQVEGLRERQLVATAAATCQARGYPEIAADLRALVGRAAVPTGYDCEQLIERHRRRGNIGRWAARLLTATLDHLDFAPAY